MRENEGLTPEELAVLLSVGESPSAKEDDTTSSVRAGGGSELAELKKELARLAAQVETVQRMVERLEGAEGEAAAPGAAAEERAADPSSAAEAAAEQAAPAAEAATGDAPWPEPAASREASAPPAAAAASDASPPELAAAPDAAAEERAADPLSAAEAAAEQAAPAAEAATGDAPWPEPAASREASAPPAAAAASDASPPELAAASRPPAILLEQEEREETSPGPPADNLPALRESAEGELSQAGGLNEAPESASAWAARASALPSVIASRTRKHGRKGTFFTRLFGRR